MDNVKANTNQPKKKYPTAIVGPTSSGSCKNQVEFNSLGKEVDLIKWIIHAEYGMREFTTHKTIYCVILLLMSYKYVNIDEFIYLSSLFFS